MGGEPRKRQQGNEGGRRNYNKGGGGVHEHFHVLVSTVGNWGLILVRTSERP